MPSRASDAAANADLVEKCVGIWSKICDLPMKACFFCLPATQQVVVRFGHGSSSWWGTRSNTMPLSAQSVRAYRCSQPTAGRSFLEVPHLLLWWQKVNSWALLRHAAIGMLLPLSAQKRKFAGRGSRWQSGRWGVLGV